MEDGELNYMVETGKSREKNLGCSELIGVVFLLCIYALHGKVQGKR